MEEAKLEGSAGTEFGKVKCPICGAMLPDNEEDAAKPPHNHLLWREGTPPTLRVVCPRRFHIMLNTKPSDYHRIEVAGIQMNILKERKMWRWTPVCPTCKVKMWKLHTKRCRAETTFKCPRCGRIE
jgi:predicted RNA-binding Zn-ribbon protein involved in translation (DUF1610 family)